MADSISTTSTANADQSVRDSNVEEYLRDVIRELRKINVYLSNMNDFVVQNEDIEV